MISSLLTARNTGAHRSQFRGWWWWCWWVGGADNHTHRTLHGEVPLGEFFFTQHKEAIDKLNILSTLRTLKYLFLVATRRARIETAALADDTHVLDIVCLLCDVLPCLFFTI